jgi:Gly-Xaa carboxypeptidase
MTHIVAPIAKKHNLQLSAFETSPSSNSGLGDSYVQLAVQGIPLEPAPKTPTSGAVWELFSGSIRAVHKDEKNDNKPYIVSPFASTGNTDTKVGRELYA